MAETLTPQVASLIPSRLHIPIRKLLIRALSLGPLPSHIAIIMDGNRRMARKAGVRLSRGHELGFEALKGLLGFFLKLNIKNVTVYAFSIDNFARPQEEVEALMELAKPKLLELAQEGALLQEYGVRVYILGRRDLLPLDVQAACAKVEQLTAHNTGGSLNVCFPYTSRDEMTHCVRTAVSDCSNDVIKPVEITSEYLASKLYTARSKGFEHDPPDLLLRTSGVCRLSDFLLWQASSSTTSIHILPRYWPEVGVADVLPIILTWQAEQLWNRVNRAIFG